MKCPYCRRRILLTAAIRSQIKHGNVIRWCPDCLKKVTVTEKEVTEEERLMKLTRYQRRVEEGLCIGCGVYTPAEGRRKCQICLDKDAARKRAQKAWEKEYPERIEEKKQTVSLLPRNKPKTLDDICRKAKKHNLSYGKYLAARARGMYLDE